MNHWHDAHICIHVHVYTIKKLIPFPFDGKWQMVNGKWQMTDDGWRTRLTARESVFRWIHVHVHVCRERPQAPTLPSPSRLSIQGFNLKVQLGREREMRCVTFCCRGLPVPIPESLVLLDAIKEKEKTSMTSMSACSACSAHSTSTSTRKNAEHHYAWVTTIRLSISLKPQASQSL